MNSQQLSELALDLLEEYKAIDITKLDVRELTSAVDTMLICSATSRRHASAVAEKLIRGLKKAGIRPYGVEGLKEGEWVLIDLTDIVVHIMLPEVREFYSLEKLWTTTQAMREGLASHDH